MEKYDEFMVMPLLGDRARRFAPEDVVTMRSFQLLPSLEDWLVSPEQMVFSPVEGKPLTVVVVPEVFVRLSPMGRDTKST